MLFKTELFFDRFYRSFFEVGVVHGEDGLLVIQVNLKVRTFHGAKASTLLSQLPFKFLAVHIFNI